MSEVDSRAAMPVVEAVRRGHASVDALVEGLGGTRLVAGALLLLAALLPLASPRARRWILGVGSSPDADAPAHSTDEDDPAPISTEGARP